MSAAHIFLTTLLCVFFFYLGAYLNESDRVEQKALMDTAKADSLNLVVHDLELKAEILNRYLIQKNLEYIEVCDLTYKK